MGVSVRALFCYITLLLFPWFPTELSIVYGQHRARVLRVFDALRLAELLRIYNGYAHIYIRLYRGNRINKVVFDIDAPDLEAAIQDAISLTAVFEEEHLPYVVVYTGNRGFHVYLLTKEVEIRDNNTARVVLKSVIDYYADAAQLRYLDAETGYKIGGWIRLPGTVHPKTGMASCYVPVPLDGLSVADLLRYARSPPCPELPADRKPVDPREYVGLANVYVPRAKPMPTLPVHVEVDRRKLRYVLDVLRPCVAYHSLSDNPSHFIRTQLATEMCWLWFSEEEICSFIEKLGWDDYDRRVTCYHVHKICEKVRQGVLYPAGCETMRERGYCLFERCQYYPRYWQWWLYV